MNTCFLLSSMILLAPTLATAPNSKHIPTSSHQVKQAAPDARLRLSLTQRKLFDVLAANEFAGCQSPWTLAYCLEKQPHHPFAQYLARLMVQAIEAGLPNHAISTFMAQTVTGPYCTSPHTLATPQAPRKGATKATITVIEFADFRCGHCKEAIPMVEEMLEAFPKQVQLFYVPVTLGGSHQSVQAARAAWAAHRQGKFWPMHLALFQHNHGLFDQQTLTTMAQNIGLHLPSFQSDLSDVKLHQEIDELQKIAEKVGLAGTPTFYINGRPFQPHPSLFSLKQRIELEMLRHQPACQ